MIPASTGTANSGVPIKTIRNCPGLTLGYSRARVMKLGPAKSSLSRNESKYDSTHGYVAPGPNGSVRGELHRHLWRHRASRSPRGWTRQHDISISCPQGSESSTARGSKGIRNRSAPELCAEKA